MDRLFLDANVLFSAAYKPECGLKRLWILSRERKTRLITSAYAAEEARRNLTQPRQPERLEKLLRRMEIVAAPPAGTRSKSYGLPAGDVPILQAAISASATHLLTGDVTHFGLVFGKTIEGILILAPGAY